MYGQFFREKLQGMYLFILCILMRNVGQFQHFYLHPVVRRGTLYSNMAYPVVGNLDNNFLFQRNKTYNIRTNFIKTWNHLKYRITKKFRLFHVLNTESAVFMDFWT